MNDDEKMQAELEALRRLGQPRSTNPRLEELRRKMAQKERARPEPEPEPEEINGFQVGATIRRIRPEAIGTVVPWDDLWDLPVEEPNAITARERLGGPRGIPPSAVPYIKQNGCAAWNRASGIELYSVEPEEEGEEEESEAVFGAPDSSSLAPRLGDVVTCHCPGDCEHRGELCIGRGGSTRRVTGVDEEEGMVCLSDGGSCPIERVSVIERGEEALCPSCGALLQYEDECVECGWEPGDYDGDEEDDGEERRHRPSEYAGEDGEVYFGAPPSTPASGRSGFVLDAGDFRPGLRVRVSCLQVNGRACSHGSCISRHGSVMTLASEHQPGVWTFAEGGCCPVEALEAIEQPEERPSALAEGIMARVDCVRVTFGACPHGHCTQRHGEVFELGRMVEHRNERCWTLEGGYCPERALTPVTEAETPVGEDGMAVAARARKKVAKKKAKAKPKDAGPLPIVEKNIDKIISMISGTIALPTEVKRSVKWIEDQKGQIKPRIERLMKSIDHISGKGSEENLTNVCEVVPELYRLFDSINHSYLRAATDHLAKIVRMGGLEESLRLQLIGITKNFIDPVFIPKDKAVIVHTDECWARGVNFGDFKISLWVNTGHLRLKALHPNIPVREGHRSSGMVHPHIEHDGGGVCLGGGGSAFSKAVKDFRICDALLIVKGVLNEYGSGPYHDIRNWEKTARGGCLTCGAVENLEICRGCRQSVCKEHAFTCVRCGAQMCAHHVQKCRDCNNAICGPCRRHSKTCGKCDGASHAAMKGDVPKWMEKAEEFKQIVPQDPKKAKPRSDKERLGGGFIE